ncbi:DUF222 domain-containing protein [Phycicoccus sp. CSK15P-2]|uniref:HNH endonuclease signature motif containing protein n=1 Tax=Phycicoccus sp. CSK15P-2 TaxID=2807627 RepID=UPI00194EA584|nr:HNH endonuclease signature motif containing protein [Phycicoccus sp. CSK15P-2]MBM6405203.1 DUF222 domain-containing protein [Phycicoccus sp. CSK15P-2]
MNRGTVSGRIAALRAECVALGRELVEHGRSLDAVEAFEVAGELQGVVNAAEGAQAVVAAFGARVETTMYESRPWGRVHPVGFVDAMAAAEMSLATGVTEGVAGRKVALGAALAERFPGVRGLVLAGDLPAVSAHRVVDACAGLDIEACERVDAELAPRLSGLDPARVTAEARRVAARVAGDQVAAQAERAKRSRCVEVRAGEDGLTDWFASLPTATSAAMWSAVESLAGERRALEPGMSVPESRADALSDLVLRNVSVSAQVTLGLPVVAGPGAPEPVPAGPGADVAWDLVQHEDDETFVDAETGALVRYGDLDPEAREAASWHPRSPEMVEPDVVVDGPWGEQVVVDPRRATMCPVDSPGAGALSGRVVSGAELPGLGWVDAATMAALLSTVPFQVARAVLDADTGTLLSHTTGAYVPPKALREYVTSRDGICRMWGCARPAERCDLDHARPWPAGDTTPGNLVALCRRHHRMKQRGRWRPVLDDDGTLTWHSPTGQQRVTEPMHRVSVSSR